MIDFFLTQGLKDDEKGQIDKMLESPMLYKKGSLIYNEETHNAAIGVVVSGCLSVKTARESDVIIRSLKKGETFGVSAVFGDGSEGFISRIYAEKDSEVVFVTEELLREIFKKFPLTVENYIRLLSGKIKYLNRKIKLLSCKTTQQAVYEIISSNCDENGVAVFENMTGLSHSLGIGRSSLYRCLEQLEEQNLIKKNGKEIKVIDYEKNI